MPLARRVGRALQHRLHQHAPPLRVGRQRLAKDSSAQRVVTAMYDAANGHGAPPPPPGHGWRNGTGGDGDSGRNNHSTRLTRLLMFVVWAVTRFLQAYEFWLGIALARLLLRNDALRQGISTNRRQKTMVDVYLWQLTTLLKGVCVCSVVVAPLVRKGNFLNAAPGLFATYAVAAFSVVTFVVDMAYDDFVKSGKLAEEVRMRQLQNRPKAKSKSRASRKRRVKRLQRVWSEIDPWKGR